MPVLDPRGDDPGSWTTFRQILLPAVGTRMLIVDSKSCPRRIRLHMPLVGLVQPLAAIGGSSILIEGAGAKISNGVQIPAEAWFDFILAPGQDLYVLTGGALPAGASLNIMTERLWETPR